MPLIYTARCPTCGDHFHASECDLAVQLDDGQLVPLRHPLETTDLERAGFTWDRAYDEARIVRCYNFVCKECGGIYERRVFSGPTGCLTMVVGGVAGVLAFAAAMSLLLTLTKYPGKWHQPLILIVATTLVAAIGWLLYRRERRAYYVSLPNRPPLADVRCCDASTPGKWVSLSHAGRQRFPCPTCDQRCTTITCTGIS